MVPFLLGWPNGWRTWHIPTRSTWSLVQCINQKSKLPTHKKYTEYYYNIMYNDLPYVISCRALRLECITCVLVLLLMQFSSQLIRNHSRRRPRPKRRMWKSRHVPLTILIAWAAADKSKTALWFIFMTLQTMTDSRYSMW